MSLHFWAFQDGNVICRPLSHGEREEIEQRIMTFITGGRGGSGGNPQFLVRREEERGERVERECLLGLLNS